MKKACIIFTTLAYILILASLVFVGSMIPRNRSIRTLFKTKYMIPAVITDNSVILGMRSRYGETPPPNVYIVEIRGDKCVIMYNYADSTNGLLGYQYYYPYSDDLLSFADNVPLSSLSYDEVKVEDARKKNNNFQFDEYRHDSVIVFHGISDQHTYYYSDSSTGYPDACLLGKHKYTINNFFFKELLIFLGVNVIFYGVAIYLSSRKRSATVPYAILTVINGILFLVPFIHAFRA